MGLISLPMSNRVGTYTYWNNVWDKSINYTTYLYSDFFLDSFFFIFFKDPAFSHIYIFFNKKIKSYKRGYLHYSKKIGRASSYIYLGRIWLFMYQNWVVIKVALFFTRKEKNKKIIRVTNAFNLFTIYKGQKNKINFFNYYRRLNYKYKI